MTSTQFPPGSLVRVRGREWVVLPGSTAELLMVQPLAGTDEERTGILTALEPAEPASFPPPSPDHPGDHRACRLLRDAVRLGVRHAAGPFRSFAKIAVEPRSYQLVPLLMALRQDPVRMLIADDVGIGKTVEAGLVAKELLERGEARRMAVLCPPHLAEQWQRELRDKFHIDAELVLSSTAARLERRCDVGQSLFDVYPFTIVSLDFIKSDSRRDEFRRACPELVLVDEAHTCSSGGRTRHQRHTLLEQLAQDASRHLVLLTATPHSGNEEAFRSLLNLLREDFRELPAELTGAGNERHRRELAKHFVQRRRGDITKYLDDDTRFPDRTVDEQTWSMPKDYRDLFDRVLDYARETVAEAGTDKRRQRIRWWSALALLRTVGSSPAAAAATLRRRAPQADADSAELADELGAKTVLDQEEDEGLDGTDQDPGVDCAPADEDSADARRTRRRFQDLAREFDAMQGDRDAKLLRAAELVAELLKQGRAPIVFCRFVATAKYVAAELQKRLPNKVQVRDVTGELPATEREERVAELAKADRYVLVCTDCLSEGINLQDAFDAVLHYDLAWNPTRHEQREGRVDRYGQRSDTVQVTTFYGDNSPIDGIVLDVLIRKHQKIRSSLGISVQIPADTNSVVQALVEGLLLRGNKKTAAGPYLPGAEGWVAPMREKVHKVLDQSAERERQSRTMFAQHAMKPEEVAPELQATRDAIGARRDVERFVRDALVACKATVQDTEVKAGPALDVTLTAQMPRTLRDMLAAEVGDEHFRARFELPVEAGTLHLPRTHPVVDALSSHVFDTALDDPDGRSIGRRAGAIRTRAVPRRTTLLLVRQRFEIVERSGRSEEPRRLLAEDVAVAAFAGDPTEPAWLSDDEAQALLAAEPAGNVTADQARDAVREVVAAPAMAVLLPELESRAEGRGQALLDAHRRVRTAANLTGVRYAVELKRPVDLLGVYVFLPAPRA
jgi:superfamily II DNA or RNA helicase